MTNAQKIDFPTQFHCVAQLLTSGRAAEKQKLLWRLSATTPQPGRCGRRSRGLVSDAVAVEHDPPWRVVHPLWICVFGVRWGTDAHDYRPEELAALIDEA